MGFNTVKYHSHIGTISISRYNNHCSGSHLELKKLWERGGRHDLHWMMKIFKNEKENKEDRHSHAHLSLLPPLPLPLLFSSPLPFPLLLSLFIFPFFVSFSPFHVEKGEQKGTNALFKIWWLLFLCWAMCQQMPRLMLCWAWATS